MTPVLRPLTALALLAAGPTLAQDGTEMSVLPDVVMTLPPAVETVPPETAASPPDVAPAPATDQAAAPTQPPLATADRSAEIAALRAAFEALKQREAADAAQRQPASEETLARIAEAETALAATDVRRRQLGWKAQNLERMANVLAAQPPGALPSTLPTGLKTEIALAVIDGDTTLYAAPATEAQQVIRTLDKPTTMLRIAETGAFTLLWWPLDGFAFALTQFRKVY